MFDAKSSRSGGETSQTHSLHIDNVLAGKKQEDLNFMIDEALDAKKRPGILKQKEIKYQANNVIKEDILERQS